MYKYIRWYSLLFTLVTMFVANSGVFDKCLVVVLCSPCFLQVLSC